MRIGELAGRTNVPARLLRYYEEQGLLTPNRSANGYREYTEGCVNRVLQIRGLLDAGLPTRIIKEILPCLDDPCTIHVTDATPELIAALERERERMDARIRCLTRNRDAIGAYLDVVRRAAEAPDVPAAPHVPAGPRAHTAAIPPGRDRGPGDVPAEGAGGRPPVASALAAGTGGPARPGTAAPSGTGGRRPGDATPA